MSEKQIKRQGVWGIDIGQCALKAVRLETIDGNIVASAFDYVEHPKILSQPDADPDQLTREALDKFLERNPLKGDIVAISVPGQSGLARFVKLPPVEEKKIPDIVRFEAKQQIPFPLDEVVWDYQKIGAGMVTDGFAMETEIGLFALKRDMVGRYLQHFKNVNVEVHIVQMSPLALCNFVATDLLKRDGQGPAEADGEAGGAKKPAAACIVALDIGTDNSNLVVTDGERVIWQRPIPFGGNHFTRALTKDLKMTFAKAEHLKRNATKSPDLKKILAALKPVLNDFVGEVQRSLGYFTNTHRNAQISYMIGLGNAFRLPGLQKFLSEKLQLDVRKLNNFERLNGESVTQAALFSQNIMSFAAAYGLALQGIHMTRLQTNLLPPEIQFERMIRAKKPWAISAAAALLVGVMALAFNYSMRYRAVAAESIADAIKEGSALAETERKDSGAFTQTQTAVNKAIDDARLIVLNPENRLDWIVLNRYINDCLPNPGNIVQGQFKSDNGKKLTMTDLEGKERTFASDEVSIFTKAGEPAEVKNLKADDEIAVVYPPELTDKTKGYWTREARYAAFKYWQRHNGGATISRPEDEGVKDLMQINVETVEPRWSTDLKNGYFDVLKTNPQTQALNGMAENDKKAAPEGPGWVVEVRGYTYHKTPDFIADSFVDALGTLSHKEPPKEAQAVNKSAVPGKGDKTQADEATKPEYWKRAVFNKISHALEYRHQTQTGTATAQVMLPSVVSTLVKSSGSFAPLSGTGGNVGLAVAVGPGAGGAAGAAEEDDGGLAELGIRGRGRRLRPAAPAASAASPLRNQPGQPAAGKAVNAARTDFVVLFVWHENAIVATSGGGAHAAAAPAAAPAEVGRKKGFFKGGGD
jgi:type IV pilus assembly protein PilM